VPPDPALPRQVLVNTGFYKLDPNDPANRPTIKAEQSVVRWARDLEYLGRTQSEDRALYNLLLKYWDQIQGVKAGEWRRRRHDQSSRLVTEWSIAIKISTGMS
jgi:hypothetical protein